VATRPPRDVVNADSKPVDGPTQTDEEALTSAHSSASVIQAVDHCLAKDHDAGTERHDSEPTSSSTPSTSGGGSLMTSFGGGSAAESRISEKTCPPATTTTMTQSIQIPASTVPPPPPAVMASLQLPSAGIERKLSSSSDDNRPTEKQLPQRPVTGNLTSSTKPVDTPTATPLQSLQQQQRMQMFLSDMFQRQFLGSLMPTSEQLSSLLAAAAAAGPMPSGLGGEVAKCSGVETTDEVRSQAVQPQHQRTCPHTCYQCGAIFGSAEHLHQHQLVQCPAASNRVSSAGATAPISRHEIPTSSAYKSRIQQVVSTHHIVCLFRKR